MGKRLSSRSRLLTALVVAIALCIVLTAIHKDEAGPGNIGPMSAGLRRFVLDPPAKLIATARVGWDADVAALFRGPRLARENARLQAQVAILSDQNRQLSQDATENTRLRSLLGFRSSSPVALWPAEVIAIKPSPLQDSITLSIGDLKGVARRMPVIGPTGALVGQITDVTRDSSDALLLTDDLSSVGVMVVPSNRAVVPGSAIVGICSGDRSPLLELKDMSQTADVRPGDRVITDGLGSVYPAGIPVGVITSVSVDTATLLKEAQVAPNTDFDNLEDVFVLPR